jgi:hypothetical protein
VNAESVGKRLGYLAGIAIAIIAVLLTVYFSYLLVTSSDQTRLAVLTAAVSIGTLVYTQSKNTKREIEGRQFAKKAEAYEEILTTLAEVLAANRDGIEVDEKALVDKLTRIQPKLLVWAGPDVLRAWQRMSSANEDPLVGLVNGNELMAAIRRELGHTSDTQLGPLGLVSTFIRGDERPNRAVV